MCSYLPQHPFFEEEETVMEAVLRRAREGSRAYEDISLRETVALVAALMCNNLNKVKG